MAVVNLGLRCSPLSSNTQRHTGSGRLLVMAAQEPDPVLSYS